MFTQRITCSLQIFINSLDIRIHSLSVQSGESVQTPARSGKRQVPYPSEYLNSKYLVYLLKGKV